MKTSTIVYISMSFIFGTVMGLYFMNAHFKVSEKSLNPNIEKESVVQNPIQSELERIEQLLDSSRPLDALTLLHDISSTINLSSDEGVTWSKLLMRAYLATNNQEGLYLIYVRNPSLFSSNENASLIIADRLIKQKQMSEYVLLRKFWLGKETEKAPWIFLDTQELIYKGKASKAIALLSAHHFRGSYEIDRLVNLAALNVVNDPKLAWNYLNEAVKMDPLNSNLRTFKANLSENIQQNNMACCEYIAAIENEPNNPYLREQLGDYYIRNGEYKNAIQVYRDTLLDPVHESIWLKTLFWSRVSSPYQEKLNNADIPEGPLKDLIVYINNLPEGVFWDEEAFNKIAEKDLYLTENQETFWLKLLGALKLHHDEKALELLRKNTFKNVSWALNLEKSLKMILNYRLATSLHNSDSKTINSKIKDVENSQQLLNLTIKLSTEPQNVMLSSVPLSLKDYFLSQEAFVIPFLASGWTEAALELHQGKNLETTLSPWIAVSITEALNQNRNTLSALDFALNQPPTPELSLLIAELALSIDQKQTVFNTLKEIYSLENVHGSRAALMLGTFLLKNNNAKDAKKVLLAQPLLKNNIKAKELLARIALKEGDVDSAVDLYKELEKYSTEAKSFLAQKAFADRNFNQAKILTEALLLDNPDNPILKENLNKIISESKKTKK